MRLELNFIVPLDHFYLDNDEWKIGLLQQYGIGVEDLFLEAMSYKIRHIVPVELVWFQQYLDVGQVQNLWHRMQGHKAATATLQGLTQLYIEVVYQIYANYFNFFKATFDHYSIVPDESNVFGNLRVSKLKWLDPNNINFHLLYDEADPVINRV